jgi:SAM-dependent methyltransferase
MALLSPLVRWVSSRPVPFIFLRGLAESDFGAVRGLVRRHLSLDAKRRTLDLGCGPGILSDLFESHDYVGVDSNPRHVDFARGNRRGTFVLEDARHVDLPDDRFDQVLIFGLLHQLPDDDVRTVLAEARRLLVSGGRMLVIEDVPVVSRLNLAGHIVHLAQLGNHVRSPEAYRELYAEAMQITHEESLRSGACDYHVALLTSHKPDRTPRT